MRPRASRLRVVPAGGPAQPVTERERRAARRVLARAQHEGRFGVSDLYEQRLEALAGVATRAGLDVLVGDLDDLLTDPSRERVLEVIRHAHAVGTLQLADFDERTERCLGPITSQEAGTLVSDLGFRIERPAGPSRVRRIASRAAPAAVVGVLSGAAVLAAPIGFGVGVSPWVPLAVGTGVFGALFAAVVTLAWKVRGPVVWRTPAVRPVVRAPLSIDPAARAGVSGADHVDAAVRGSPPEPPQPPQPAQPLPGRETSADLP